MVSAMGFYSFRSGCAVYQSLSNVLHFRSVSSFSSLSIISPSLITFGRDRKSRVKVVQSPQIVSTMFSSITSASRTSAGTSTKRKIGVQGAALDKGQPKVGVAHGPTTCRKSGFIEILRDSVKVDIKDYGDIPLGLNPRLGENGDTSAEGANAIEEIPSEEIERVNKAKHVKQVARATKAISSATTKVIQDGRICLTLGGDHSIAIGTVHGASEIYNDLALLWVDAHSDINTIRSSNSGNIHGMSVAFLIKELQPYMDQLKEFSWITPRISAKNMAYIGLRDVEDSERAILELLGIVTFSMREVDKYGIRKVTQMALECIAPGNKRPLHLSFDIDSLDDQEVACTGTRVPGGLTLREGIVIVEEVHEAGNLVSMDLVEVNPKLGNHEEMTRVIQVVKNLLVNAFGYNRGGVTGGRTVPPPNSN